MRKYLSFGGGVNSVAMMLMLLDQGEQFEAVFVNHGTDWPETYEYFNMFQGWLITRGLPRITVLRPNYSGYSNLYDYCWYLKIVPVIYPRWCTSNFKIKPLFNYYKKPCFQYIGIDYGEQKRAKISTEDGVENRYPLIESEVDRNGCKRIIEDHGLPVPLRSGCYICPYQRVGQWKNLRRNEPDLFCKAEKLEQRNQEYRKSKGKKPMYISPRKASLRAVVEETQAQIFEQDEYPPCQCGL